MPIIIDMDCINAVFSPDCADHREFEPIGTWILEGPGKLVVGGCTYRAQLSKLKRVLALTLELAKIGKVIALDDAAVDLEEQRILQLCTDAPLNDAHLIAMVCVSGCSLVCTKDRIAMEYLKESRFYRKNRRRPRIYSGKRNADLLIHQNRRRLIGVHG